MHFEHRFQAPIRVCTRFAHLFVRESTNVRREEAFFFSFFLQTVRKGTQHTRGCIQLRQLISASVQFTAQEQSKKFARGPAFRVTAVFLGE